MTLALSTLVLVTGVFLGERRCGKAIVMWAACQFAGGAIGLVLAVLLVSVLLAGAGVPVSVLVMVLLLIAGLAVGVPR
ncbi:hypothetical protein RKE29_15065 [Streptomyces sp. B1866]|uniref:hypothetical protein n=1 Tax=Streptomyces sp. B1866 TaxID=3075431 RepID=UPI00288F8746|nr:hypothetical protein [Streptomyces sp. B1866]MDT3397948.1 hypothetical protein [Streptomyces sp. B1866]